MSLKNAMLRETSQTQEGRALYDLWEISRRRQIHEDGNQIRGLPGARGKGDRASFSGERIFWNPTVVMAARY